MTDPDNDDRDVHPDELAVRRFAELSEEELQRRLEAAKSQAQDPHRLPDEGRKAGIEASQITAALQRKRRRQ